MVVAEAGLNNETGTGLSLTGNTAYTEISQ